MTTTTNAASSVKRVLDLLKPWGSGKYMVRTQAKVLELILMEDEHFSSPKERFHKVLNSITYYGTNVADDYVADALEALFVGHYTNVYEFVAEFHEFVEQFASDPNQVHKAYMWYRSATLAILGTKVWAEKGGIENTSLDLDFPHLFGDLLCLLARTAVAGGSKYGEENQGGRLGSFSNDLAYYLSYGGFLPRTLADIEVKKKESKRRAKGILSQLIEQDFEGLSIGEGGSVLRDVMYKLQNLLTFNEQVGLLSDFFDVELLLVTERGNVYAVVTRGTVNLKTHVGTLVFASPEDAKRYIEFIQHIDVGKTWNPMKIELVSSLPKKMRNEDFPGLFFAFEDKHIALLKELAKLRILKPNGITLEDLQLEFGTRFDAITFSWKKPEEELPF